MPSEPGPYWWRRGADSPWQFAHVDEDVRQFCVWEEYTGHAGEWSIYPVHGMEWGEWGGRIPDNPTLKAMKELANAAPWATAQVTFSIEGLPVKGVPASFSRAICIYCGEPLMGGHCEHDPTCPWLRAQEARDAE